MLLAADVGGTKTLLGVFSRSSPRPTAIDVREFSTERYSTLLEMVEDFLDATAPRSPIEAACFGVAGPVLGQVAHLTNQPFTIDSTAIGQRFGIERVALLNDLASMAYAVPVLEPHEQFVLQKGAPDPAGNAALIAAGTGLGEALLHRVGGKIMAAASEAGHADFAPRTPREIELLQWLIGRDGRASYEQVISGAGLVNLYRFTHPPGSDSCTAVDRDTPEHEIPASMSAAALARSCDRCVEALDLFVSAYGAEAGNMALRSVATAGVFIGGGIAPKILPLLRTGAFIEAFQAKEPMAALVRAIPVAVILNDRAGLLGSAVFAAALQ